MTKREVINALEASPLSDDAPVKIYDHRKNLTSDHGEGSSDGIYDFEVGALNDNLTDEEIEEIRDEYGIESIPFIVLVFDNPDIEDILAEEKNE